MTVKLDKTPAAVEAPADPRDLAAMATQVVTAQAVQALTGEDFRSFNSKYTSGPNKGEIKPEEQRNKGFYTVLTLKRSEALAAGYPAEVIPAFGKVKVAVTVTIVAPDPDDA